MASNWDLAYPDAPSASGALPAPAVAPANGTAPASGASVAQGPQKAWDLAYPDAPTPAAMDVAANAPKPSTVGGVLNNFGAGASDVLAKTLSAPSDLIDRGVTGLANLGIGGYNALTGSHVAPMQPMNDYGATKKAFGATMGSGANPDTVPTNGAAEAAARAAGSGAAAMGLTYMGGAALGGPASLAEAAGADLAAPPLAPGVAPAAARAVLDAASQGSLVGNTAMGAAAGLGGYAGQNAVPEKYAPLGNFAGQLLGGGLVGGIGAGAKALWRGASDLAGNFLRPVGLGAKEAVATDSETGAPIMATQGQQQAAAQRIAQAATGGKNALAGQLDEGLERPQIVPGSEPTTYQLTGNQGVGQLERAQATANPAPFLARRADQNAAQVGALDALAQTGDPAAVGNFFRQQLAQNDARQEAAVAMAAQQAQAAREGLGGNGSVQDYGQILRGHLDDALGQQKALEGHLWNAIDPEGKLALNVSPAKDAAAEITTAMSPYERPMDGEEAAIMQQTANMPEVMPFQDLTALRGRLLEAIRQERQNNYAPTPALRRMQMLRQAMDNTIATGAERAADVQNQAVQMGLMSPEETIAANLKSQIDQWQNARNASQASAIQPAARGNPSVVSGGTAGIGPSAVRGIGGAEGAPGGGLGNASGGPGVSGEPLTPNFDAGAAQRYRNAADATRQRAETFGVQPVKGVLARGEAAGSYRLPDSQVAAKFFNGGPHAAEDVQGFLRATGGRNEAVDTLQDYAAHSLRQAAERDGVLDPARTQAWLGKHSDALQAFPELSQRFQDAATAQQTVNDLAAVRAQRLKDAQGFAAQRFIGNDPVQAVASALRSKNPSAEFAKLARRAGLDKTGEAKAGLKAAVLEYIKRSTSSSEPAGETGTLMLRPKAVQDLLAKHGAALKWVFGEDGIKTIQSVADDLARSYPTKTKLPAGPGTAQDLTAAAKHGGGHGNDSLLAISALAAEHVVGPKLAAAGALALKLRNVLAANGVRTTDQLVTEAMLHPELARTLLTKATPDMRPSIINRLNGQLKTLAGTSAVAATSAQAGQPQRKVDQP